MPETPDEYDEMSTAEGQSAVSTGTRIMEFAAEDGDTFTVFERIRGGYVGRHISSDNTETFYEIKPDKVAQEITGWPGQVESEAAEVATQPLMAAGWEITYYDEENAAMRMQDLYRED